MTRAARRIGLRKEHAARGEQCKDREGGKSLEESLQEGLATRGVI